MNKPVTGAPVWKSAVLSDTETEFEWFFADEYGAVLRSVFFVLHDRAKAEDIAQDAFVQLYAHWAKVSKYERPEAWVRRVAIRLAVRAARRERLRQVLERGAPSAPMPLPVDVDLLRAVRQLSPKQRAAVVLYYFEDRPVFDVAKILGCSAATANVHLHRARKRLAELLGEEVSEDVP